MRVAQSENDTIESKARKNHVQRPFIVASSQPEQSLPREKDEVIEVCPYADNLRNITAEQLTTIKSLG